MEKNYSSELCPWSLRTFALFVSALVVAACGADHAHSADRPPNEGRLVSPVGGLTDGAAFATPFRYTVQVSTQEPGDEPTLFRTGTVTLTREAGEPGRLLTAIEYSQNGSPTGSFQIVQNASSLAMEEFTYEKASGFGGRRTLRVHDGVLFGGPSGKRKLQPLDTSVYAPENKELALAFLQAEVGEVLALPLAGFGKPATGYWRVRYDGRSTFDLGGHAIPTRKWSTLGRPGVVHTVARPPYVLYFDLTDAQGVRWIHRVDCTPPDGIEDPLASCVETVL